MNTLLADMFALYMKTKNFHWHVSGPHVPQGNESRLTRLWLQWAESVQQVLRVPGGTLAAALD